MKIVQVSMKTMRTINKLWVKKRTTPHKKVRHKKLFTRAVEHLQQ
jgi:hypothetical protein